jgi:hypothetical protein
MKPEWNSTARKSYADSYIRMRKGGCLQERAHAILTGIAFFCGFNEDGSRCFCDYPDGAATTPAPAKGAGEQ